MSTKPTAVPWRIWGALVIRDCRLMEGQDYERIPLVEQLGSIDGVGVKRDNAPAGVNPQLAKLDCHAPASYAGLESEIAMG